MKTVRELNWAGPCIDLGVLTRETKAFWFFSRNGGREERVKKDGLRGKYHIHMEPCDRCVDHPKTNYPRGFDL